MGAAEDAGSVEAELRLNLTQMEKDALEAQRKMDALAAKLKEKGEKGGTMYVQGFGKAQQQLNTRLNNMVSSLQGVSPKMGALGAKMASVFSKPIFSMVPVVSAAFQAMLPIIGTIIVAVGALIKGISSAAKSHKEFTNNVKLSREVSAKLKDTTVELNAAQQKTAEITARQEHNSAVMNVAFQKLGDFFSGVFLPIINAVRSGFTAIGDAVSWVADKLGIVSTAEAEAAVEAQKLKGVNEEVVKSYDDYKRQLTNLENAERLGAKTAEDKARGRLSVMENYIDSLIKARGEAEALAGKNSARVREIEKTITAVVRERNEVAALVKEYDELGRAKEGKTLQERLDDARLQTEREYLVAIRKANNEKEAGLIDQAGLQKKLEEAEIRRYNALADIVAIEGLESGYTVDQAKAAAELVKSYQDIAKAKEYQKNINGIMLDQGNELRRLEIEAIKARASTAKSEKEKNALLEEALELEIKILREKRKEERINLENLESFKAQSEEVKIKILADFDAITDAMENAMRTADKRNWLAEAMGMTDKQLDDMMTVGDAAINAFANIADAALEVSRKHAEEQIAGIEKALKEMLDLLEEAREAELEQKGFIEAQSEEEFDKQIERAKEAGDEVLQYHLNRRKEELAINKEYDAKVKEQEEKAAREKADIEFELAKQEHALQIIQAANAAVMAVMQALASAKPPINFILAGLVGGAASVQIGLLTANPPKPPHFADGGIVPGRKSDGDVQHIVATAGEVILNEAQQKTVAGKLEGRSYTQLTVIMQMDGREVAQVAADVYGSGRVTIPIRGIAR